MGYLLISVRLQSLYLPPPPPHFYLPSPHLSHYQTKHLNNSLCEFKESMTISDQFPCGLRVLVVDDDASCLIILEKMLLRLMYQGDCPISLFKIFSKVPSFLLCFCSYHLLPSRRRFNPLERKKRLFRSGLERCSYAWYERLQTPPASRSRDGSSCHQ